MSMISESSFLYGSNAAFVLEKYEQYLLNPTTLDPEWQQFFAEFKDELQAIRSENARTIVKTTPKEVHSPMAKQGDAVPADITRSIKALMMIRSYRVRGHLEALLDPLGINGREYAPELDPHTYGFSDEDMDTPIYIGGSLGLETATLSTILSVLRKTYCGSIAVEFMHSQNPDHKMWIQERIENYVATDVLTQDDRRDALKHLLNAETFEQFLNTKHTGAKKFGIDGCEAFIPGLYEAIDVSAKLGVEDVVIGMAHRGRLNVLSNIMGKPLVTIFSEFQGTITHADDVSSGDVKYHQGFSADKVFDKAPVHLSLNANPSHLEAVDPVTLGKTRAKQDIKKDQERRKVMGVLIHGDAAFIGQGIVPECFGLSDLQGYKTGGTLHVVINNQIGFTTDPMFSRSSAYCTEMAKTIQAPVFHVNGDSVDDVIFMAQLAAEFRHTFNKDVVLDIIGYRRYGHNESDDPSFTQPKMYKVIKDHPTVLSLYAKQLISENIVTSAEFDTWQAERQQVLLEAFEEAMQEHHVSTDWLQGHWSGLRASGDEEPVSDVTVEQLKAMGKALITLPKNLHHHPRLPRLLKQKEEMFATGKGIDWATAEALALGSLLLDGTRVRMTGQDTCRGTFSQRHAVWVDQEDGHKYTPLNHLSDTQAPLEIIDSPLSEFAVLGFEYGYSSADPRSLVIWEAQFGDFANTAQVIFDQFISSAESKWHRMSGLVVLLPHGYEGQGPEHSSARPERYLQLCAENNMIVANCTTPANYFHILRRQMHRPYRKPLILFTPKSLLRDKAAVSSLADMATGTSFEPVLQDTDVTPKKVQRVVFCTGKVFYELAHHRQELKQTGVALIRIEQLYPWPEEALNEILATYPKTVEVVWCQEEPENMGAWQFVDRRLEKTLSTLGWKNPRPTYAGRKASASPATGFLSLHKKEQNQLIYTALTMTE